MKRFFEVKALTNNTAEVFIFGEITNYESEDGMSSKMFKRELDALGNVTTIHVHINSIGGSVFEGIAISNMLKQHKAKTIGHVDALAASIASNIIASCDEVRMPANSMLMIHNAMIQTAGNAKEIRKAAEDLERINEVQIQTYMAKVGNKTTEANIRQLMANETWLSAQEAYELGLCDVVEEIGSDKVIALSDRERQKIILDSKKNHAKVTAVLNKIKAEGY